MLVESSMKVFEKPKSGLYRGVLADVVNLGPVTQTYQGKTKVSPMVRLVWILNAKDSEGNYFRVMRQVTASMAEKANLYGIVRDIILGTPEVPFELETIIGRNSELVVALEKSKKGKDYANVKAIMAPLSTEVFRVPADFVRSKDRKNTQTTSAQTAAPASTATAAAPVQADEEDIPF
jgi:hypothetical protein